MKPETTKQLRNDRALASNRTTTADGLMVSCPMDDYYAYGFRELHVWDRTAQSRKNLCLSDEDKFVVIAYDYETARAEFWARWKIFCQRAYKIAFIRIETIELAPRLTDSRTTSAYYE